MTGDVPLILTASAGILLLLCPGLVILFAGIPEWRGARALAVLALLAVVVSGGLWMLLGAPVGIAAFQGAIAATATVTLLAVLSPGRRAAGSILFVATWLVVVVVPVGYLAFDVVGGWLSAAVGMVDFGGAAQLCLALGAAALALLVVGLRGSEAPEAPALGVGSAIIAAVFLGAGWMVLLVGAEFQLDSETGTIALNTALAALAGTTGMVVTDGIRSRRIAPVALPAGLTAGVIAILPAVPWLQPGFAILIGALGGILSSIGFSAARKARWGRWAAPIAVTLVSGSVGMLLPGLLANGDGFIYSGQPDLLISQSVGLALILVGSTAVSFLLALLARPLLMPRQPEPPAVRP